MRWGLSVLVFFCFLGIVFGSVCAEQGQVVLRKVPGHAASMFMGNPSLNGVSSLPGVRQGRRVWEVQLPGGIYASPASDTRGRTYWATFPGVLHVLDLQGGEVGRFDLEGSTVSSPAVARDGTIVAATVEGDVIALSSDLRQRWRISLGLEIRSSPILDEVSGLVLISAEDRTCGLELHHKGRVRFCFDAGSGKLSSTPALGPDGLTRVVSWGGFVVALRGSGEVAWRTSLGQTWGGSMTVPHMDSRGQLYTAGRSGGSSRLLYALDPEGGIRWRKLLDDPVSSFMAVLPDDRLVLPGQRALKVLKSDGSEGWQLPLGGDRSSSNMLVSRDGEIYFGSMRGQVWAVSSEGEVLWREKVGGRLQAAPVLARGSSGASRLLVGNVDGRVFCFQ